jgi:pimeloyl-ACP methyl ester carboxylesterase
VRRTLAASAAAATLATAFVGVGNISAAAAPTAPATAAKSALRWGSCGPGMSRQLQCATVAVPLDYGKPNGSKIDLRVSRAKATGSAKVRQGVLLVNPGGPGGPGLGMASAVQSWLPKNVRDAYDIIGFDPRGVGMSHTISCGYPGSQIDGSLPDPNDEGSWPFYISEAQDFAAACLKRNGSALRHFTTRNTARDMERIRAALGEQKINFLGYSYGSYLGAVYATMFPTRARRFLLDSNVDPTGIWYKDNLDQIPAFETRFRRFLAWTAAGNEVFELGADAAQVRAAWNRMRAQLGAEPLLGFVGPAEWDQIGASAMYSDQTWPLMAQLMRMYLRGELDETAEEPDGEEPDGEESEGDDNMYAMYTAVSCNDAAFPHSVNTVLRDTERLHATSPFAAWSNTFSNLPCAFWPNEGIKPVAIGSAATAQVRTLLVNAVDDPATPHLGAVRMNKALRGSRLVTVTGTGNHGQYLFERNACVDAHGAAFLLSGKLPAGNVSCTGNKPPKAELDLFSDDQGVRGRQARAQAQPLLPGGTPEAGSLDREDWRPGRPPVLPVG